MTCVPTWEAFLYLAVVTDACSRKVVGWAFGVQMTAYLIIAALNMALHTRKLESVIHHSDQGSQLGFKESSQHQLVELWIVGHSMLRQAFSFPKFYEACY